MIRPSPGTLRRVVFASLVLSLMLFGVAALFAPSSQAAPAGNCTYYGNGSYTTVVGQFGYDCCNNYIAWGVKTRFARCGGCFICYPPPR